MPNAALYEELKPLSRNLGAKSISTAWSAGTAQTANGNAAGPGGFFLYRIGDAWAARNIHAAMLDAMRVCRDL